MMARRHDFSKWPLNGIALQRVSKTQGDPVQNRVPFFFPQYSGLKTHFAHADALVIGAPAWQDGTANHDQK
jgi:hypothetical protein